MNTPPPRALRRNDIVHEKDFDFWTPFGRVNRVIDAETVEVAWGKDGVRIEKTAELAVDNAYRGYVDKGRCVLDPETNAYTHPNAVFRRMRSLRQLKQAAVSRGRGAWARDRERFAAEKAAQQAEWDAEDAAEAAASMPLAA